MTLVVETGEGVDGADSYLSVADCAAYAEARGLSFDASPEEDAEAALRRATQFIDTTYGPRFPGTRAYGREQSLMWPRVNAVDKEGEDIDDESVPAEIISATAEAAIRELETPGSLQEDLDRGGAVRRVKAGSVEVEYAGNAPSGTVYQKIDALLSNLIGPRSNTSVGWVSRG